MSMLLAHPDLEPFKMGQNRKLTAFRLPPELVEQLEEVSEAEGRTRTDIVELALRRYLKSWKAQRKRKRRGKLAARPT